MADVTRPPEDLYVLGYSWQKNHASGGCREVFLRDTEVVRRIDDLRREYPGDALSNVHVHHLVRDHPEHDEALVWTPVVVHTASPTHLELDGETP